MAEASSRVEIDVNPLIPLENSPSIQGQKAVLFRRPVVRGPKCARETPVEMAPCAAFRSKQEQSGEQIEVLPDHSRETL